MTCERCGHESDLDPGDRDNDPVAEYAAEKCVGEGGHLYTWGDAPLWPPKPPVER